MSAGTIVEARAVSYAVRQKHLVADVSFGLEAGRMTIVIGPNGAGKSTLLRLMSGELPPSSGQVYYGDTEVRVLPPWRLALRRAVMAQVTRLAFDFSVYEVVRLGVDSIGLSRAVREATIDEALTQAEISHLAGRSYGSLSGGEQQQVQFARTLSQILAGRGVSAGQTLFLDEPTAYLDMAHQCGLMDGACHLAKAGVAVFVVMHDLNLAAAYADHLIVLNAGRLVAQGRPEEVLTNDLVAEVFRVKFGVGELPPSGMPFLLPHRHAAASRQARPL